jgi:hypothetical protein
VKKYFFSVIIVLILLVSIIGCNKESQDSINASNQQTNQNSISSSAEVTYTNEEYGFSLVLPGYWKDQFIVENVNGVGIRIRHKPTWSKTGGGTIFQISVFDKTSDHWKRLDVKGDIIDTPAVGMKIIYQDDKEVFAFSFPTDVQYIPDDKELYNGYKRMDNDVLEIVKTFKKIN